MSDPITLTIPSADELKFYEFNANSICIEQTDGLGESTRVFIPVDRVEQVVALLRQTAVFVREAAAQSPEAIAIKTYANK